MKHNCFICHFPEKASSSTQQASIQFMGHYHRVTSCSYDGSRTYGEVYSSDLDRLSRIYPKPRPQYIPEGHLE